MNPRRPDSTRRRALLWLLALVLSLSLPSARVPGTARRSKSTPVACAVPAASAAELADLVGGNTAFGFDLHQALSAERNEQLLLLAPSHTGGPREGFRRPAVFIPEP